MFSSTDSCMNWHVSNRQSESSSKKIRKALKLCHFIDEISDFQIVSPYFSAARQTCIFSFTERASCLEERCVVSFFTAGFRERKKKSSELA